MPTPFIYPIPRELTVGKLQIGPDQKGNVQTSSMADAEYTQVFTGGRWKLHIEVPTEQNLTAERLKTLVTRLNGYGNRFWTYDWSRPAPKGATAITELMDTPTFVNGLGAWAAGVGGITRNASRMKILNTGAAQAYAQRSIATVIGLSYMVDTFLYAGNEATYDVAVGTAAGLADVASTTGSGLAKRVLLKFTATSNPTWIRVGSNSAVAGQFVFADYVSASRIPLVNGAGQTGNTLKVDGLDINTNGAFVEGDWFQFNKHIYRLTSDADVDGTGNAWLEFMPALRSSPADNDPILFYKAACPFRQATLSPMFDIETGGITGYAVDALEAVLDG